MNQYKGLWFLLTILSSLISIGIIINIITLHIEFKQNCTSYLKGAANANSISLAINRLQPAILFLEQNHKTQGYSHIFIKTEDANVTFWFQNLKSAQHELLKIQHTTLTPLEESNVLMKLKETIMEQNQYGSYVTLPPHIVFFPQQTQWALTIITLLLTLNISAISIIKLFDIDIHPILPTFIITLTYILIILAI